MELSREPVKRKQSVEGCATIPCLFLAAVCLVIAIFIWKEYHDAKAKRLRIECERRLQAMGVSMLLADEVEDSDEEGFVDREVYLKLRLTAETYDRVFRVAKQEDTPSPFPRYWPWTIPARVTRFNKLGPNNGRWMIFIPETQEVFVCWW